MTQALRERIGPMLIPVSIVKSLTLTISHPISKRRNYKNILVPKLLPPLA